MKKIIKILASILIVAYFTATPLLAADDAVDHYIRLLRSSDASAQERAAEMLGQGKDPRAIEPLIKLIEDMFSPLDDVVLNTEADLQKTFSGMGDGTINFDLVKAAGQALAHIGIPSADPYAKALRSKNIFVRWTLLGIIRNAKSNYAVELYAIAMRDTNALVRAMTVHCLDNAADARSIELLLQALRDKSETVRKEAQEVLDDVKLVDPQALNRLADAVADDDPAVRRAVVRVLSNSRHPAAVKPLIRALGDKDDAVKLMAIPALGGQRDPSAVEGLIVTLQDRNTDVRWKSAGSLGLIQDPRAVDALIHALGDEISLVRDEAKSALVRIKPPAVEKLIAALKEDDQNVRNGAAYVLGRLQDPKAVPYLIDVLNDDTYDVKAEAIRALGAIPDARAVDELMDATRYVGYIHLTAGALGRQKDRRAVDLLITLLNKGYPRIANALGEIGDPRAVKPIIAALKTAPDRKPEFIEALGKLGDPGVLDLLVGYLNDDNYDLQASAARALKYLNDRRAVRPLCAAMKTKRPDYVMALILEALEEIKDPAAVPDLIRVLEDTNVHLFNRRRAGNALVSIGTPAVKPLIAVVRDNRSKARGSAVEALGRIKDPKAVEPLIAAASDDVIRNEAFKALVKIGSPSVEPLISLLSAKDDRVQLLAIVALGAIKDPKSTGALITVLKEGAPYNQAEAAKALGAIKDKRAVEPLIDALGSQHLMVRMNTIEALGELRDKRALSYLQGGAMDKDENIRRATEKALKQISAGD
jgi:HEAT repeat protein